MSEGSDGGQPPEPGRRTRLILEAGRAAVWLGISAATASMFAGHPLQWAGLAAGAALTALGAAAIYPRAPLAPLDGTAEKPAPEPEREGSGRNKKRKRRNPPHRSMTSVPR